MMLGLLVGTRWHRPISLCSFLLWTTINMNPGNNAKGNQRKTLKGGKKKVSWLGTPGLHSQHGGRISYSPLPTPRDPAFSTPDLAGEDTPGTFFLSSFNKIR